MRMVTARVLACTRRARAGRTERRGARPPPGLPGATKDRHGARDQSRARPPRPLGHCRTPAILVKCLRGKRGGTDVVTNAIGFEAAARAAAPGGEVVRR